MEKLKKVVLCGPQDLPNMMKEVMLLKDHHLESLPHGKILLDSCVCAAHNCITIEILLPFVIQDDHRLFIQKHVATENALRVILKKVLDPKAEDESLQYLCLLLRAYGLIFKVENGGSDEASPPPEGQQPPPQYLVPCKLKAMTPDEIPKPKQESFSFVADFEGYLPQEAFTRFACWAALKSKASMLRPPKSKTKYHLTQNFCSVKHFMIKGDAWLIRCDDASSKMVFDVR